MPTMIHVFVKSQRALEELANKELLALALANLPQQWIIHTITTDLFPREKIIAKLGYLLNNPLEL